MGRLPSRKFGFARADITAKRIARFKGLPKPAPGVLEQITQDYLANKNDPHDN